MLGLGGDQGRNHREGDHQHRQNKHGAVGKAASQLVHGDVDHARGADDHEHAANNEGEKHHHGGIDQALRNRQHELLQADRGRLDLTIALRVNRNPAVLQGHAIVQTRRDKVRQHRRDGGKDKKNDVDVRHLKADALFNDGVAALLYIVIVSHVPLRSVD